MSGAIPDGGPFIFVLVGAGLHFAGRKVAPGTHAASVAGGMVGIGIATVIGALIFAFLYILIHPGEWLGWLFELLGW